MLKETNWTFLPNMKQCRFLSTRPARTTRPYKTFLAVVGETRFAVLYVFRKRGEMLLALHFFLTFWINLRNWKSWDLMAYSESFQNKCEPVITENKHCECFPITYKPSASEKKVSPHITALLTHLKRHRERENVNAENEATTGGKKKPKTIFMKLQLLLYMSLSLGII